MKQWDLVIPPSRPSAAQLAQIKFAIEGFDRSVPVAVLGSTPEFRDLLCECSFETIHVLDRNLGFYNSTSSSRIYNNPEIFVHGDWLNSLKQFSGTFSLVLSDLTSGNIPYEHRPEFYELISRSLKIGGLFCDKVLTHPVPHIPVGELSHKYARLPLNLLHVNYFSCEMLFCSELLNINATVDSSAFYGILERQITDARVKAFIKAAHAITPANCIWWYGRRWKDLALEYCPALEVTAVYDDDVNSPYFGRAKQFIHARQF